MAIETRPYFLFGDLLGCVVAGIAASFVAAVLPAVWPMALSMPLGMVAGMLAGLVIAAMVVPFFGMESMPPAMMTGMIAGMVATMAPMLDIASAEHSTVAPTTRLMLGALTGAVVFVGMYLLNAAVSGRDRRWSS